MQAANEKTGTDEKYDGQCALQNEEHDARSRAVVRPFARASLEIVGELDAARQPDGRDSR